MHSFNMANVPFNLRRVAIVAPKTGRLPRRNPRDPRLPSYKPPPPTIFTGKTITIPLEYNPVLDARPQSGD